jgi:hypothetical protein
MRRSPEPLVLLLDAGCHLSTARGLMRRMAGTARQQRHIRHAYVPVTARYEAAVLDLVCLLVIQAASRLLAATRDQRLRDT